MSDDSDDGAVREGPRRKKIRYLSAFTARSGRDCLELTVGMYISTMTLHAKFDISRSWGCVFSPSRCAEHTCSNDHG